tara:strand:+ start:860 stop:1294 length:435 start_codon:yes stop_codon:yes gene_type:complete
MTQAFRAGWAVLKEDKYPCDACGSMVPDSDMINETGPGIDEGNPMQICSACVQRSNQEQVEECAECFGASGEDRMPDSEFCRGCDDYLNSGPGEEAQTKHTCQDGDEECNECLEEWRRNRYGDDIHDTRCVCNECQGWGFRADY